MNNLGAFALLGPSSLRRLLCTHSRSPLRSRSISPPKPTLSRTRARRCNPARMPGSRSFPFAPRAATGPLHANLANPRYFTDGSGKAIYLTGSHTWSNLMDRGTLHPPQVPFDYSAYMKWMVAHNFNFMRLWTAELPDSGEY